tara:strand:+ start:293 stop:517 length:225 start_codon:yes stop_codon:yes gene_type:complete
MPQNQGKSSLRQRAGLVMAGSGLFWIIANYAGQKFGLPMRTRAFFDIIALVGFGFALYLAFQLWRDRQHDKDEG